jgi:hypothetical protein
MVQMKLLRGLPWALLGFFLIVLYVRWSSTLTPAPPAVPDVSAAAATPANSIRSLVLRALYGSLPDPFHSFTNRFGVVPDWTYPHTNVGKDLQRALVKVLGRDPKNRGFFVEAGTFKGGSADRLADVIEEAGVTNETVLLCIDPFTGDVNMWCDEWGIRPWLMITDGAPRVYDQFMVNMIDHKRQYLVLPMVATSIVGFRSITRLQSQNKLPKVDLIYLDSAHEEYETYVELNLAWDILRPGGFIFGDDWDWPAVRSDVRKFADTVKRGTAWPVELQGYQSVTPVLKLASNNQWILLK